MHKTSSVDAYIAQFPLQTQQLLNAVRQSISKIAPTATEDISYGIPTFKLNGNLVHFAAYKTHVGFYPGPQALLHFKEDIAKYKNSKGAVQFPLTTDLPLDLIEKITRYCVAERQKKIAAIQSVFKVAAPARKALANKGINNLKELSKYTEDEILALHGVGKTAIPVLKQQLAEESLKFRK